MLAQARSANACLWVQTRVRIALALAVACSLCVTFWASGPPESAPDAGGSADAEQGGEPVKYPPLAHAGHGDQIGRWHAFGARRAAHSSASGPPSVFPSYSRLSGPGSSPRTSGVTLWALGQGTEVLGACEEDEGGPGFLGPEKVLGTAQRTQQPSDSVMIGCAMK